MDKTSQAPEVQVVDLGDAKELTMGVPSTVREEDNPEVDKRF